MYYQSVVICQHNSCFINSLLFHFQQWCETISEKAFLSLRICDSTRHFLLCCKAKFHFTDFEKFHPPLKKSTLHVYWFLRFFPPSTPRLLDLSTSFFQKIPPSTFIPTSTFIDFANFAPPPLLFQPPGLVIWQLLHPLHVY